MIMPADPVIVNTIQQASNLVSRANAGILRV